MAAIRGRNTRPEMIVRQLLHAAGFRYRLHSKDLPGRPDLSLPKWNAVIEVHGCFFHAHDCHLFKSPSDNAEFWTNKLAGNVERDSRNARATADLGIRRLVVWQCALTGKTRLEPNELVSRIAAWMRGSEFTGEVRGGE